MSDYSISPISPTDKRGQKQLIALLEAEGIRKDANLDYTCGMYDEDYNLIATGSCFGNTMRCMAVSSAHQGEGLMNEIVGHLMEVQYARGNTHLFLYTKCDSAKFFGDLGFYEIARIPGQIVFMENRKTGFTEYLNRLAAENTPWNSPAADPKGSEAEGTVGTDAADASDKEAEARRESDRHIADAETSMNVPRRRTAALVMNANPFTLGHQYLVEKAAAENDLLHLFIVSEDASLVPFAVRKQLVMEGTAHLHNIIYHESGPYIISSATFPSYFQKDESAVIESHAMLDLTIFTRIARALGINRRYVGEEPTSLVTGIYNRIMSEKLPENGIECHIIPRKEKDGRAISASTVRQAVKDNNWDLLAELVPDTTLRYFRSQEAEPVVRRIRAEGNVIHY